MDEVIAAVVRHHAIDVTGWFLTAVWFVWFQTKYPPIIKRRKRK